MLDDATALALSAVLAWAMLMFASTVRSRTWTPEGLRTAVWTVGVAGMAYALTSLISTGA